MPCIGLVLAYDGTPYSGWQRQENAPSVQASIERVLAQLHGGHACELRGASRTDAGVHAECQIAAFDTPRKNYSPERWVVAINSLTPPSIHVRHAFVAPDGFNPRYVSLGKHYRYWLWEGRYLPPALVNRAMTTRKLDTVAMQEAANYLIGTHDFSAFRAIDCQAQTTVREITSIVVSRPPSPFFSPLSDKEDGLIQIDVYGTAFLKHMVRIIVGTLMTFGEGRDVAEMANILEQRYRPLAGQTVIGAGLCLVESFSEIIHLNPPTF